MKVVIKCVVSLALKWSYLNNQRIYLSTILDRSVPDLLSAQIPRKKTDLPDFCITPPQNFLLLPNETKMSKLTQAFPNESTPLCLTKSY